MFDKIEAQIVLLAKKLKRNKVFGTNSKGLVKISSLFYFLNIAQQTLRKNCNNGGKFWLQSFDERVRNLDCT